MASIISERGTLSVPLKPLAKICYMPIFLFFLKYFYRRYNEFLVHVMAYHYWQPPCQPSLVRGTLQILWNMASIHFRALKFDVVSLCIGTDFLSFISFVFYVSLILLHFSVQWKTIINGFELFSPLLTWKVERDDSAVRTKEVLLLVGNWTPVNIAEENTEYRKEKLVWF